MSTRDIYGNDVSGRSEHEQRRERAAAVEDPEAAYIVDETPEFRPTVEMEIQAKVDTNHPDAKRAGLTLEAEERIEAWEHEVERTRTRMDRSVASDREARTAGVARAGSRERRLAFDRRAGSVDGRLDPDEADPRERLTREQLGAVNREARRIQAGIPEAGSTAAISRRLAEEVLRTGDVLSATVSVAEGERIRVRKAAKSWYQGRVSVALTAWSRVESPEREAWWEPGQ